MNNRKKIFDFACERISGFELKGSSYGDNRSIFSLIEKLIRSTPEHTLAACRDPLMAVLSLRANIPRPRFMGCKLELLQDTIRVLFGEQKHFLPDKDFKEYDKEMLLEYLEICRRMFVTKYVVAPPPNSKTTPQISGLEVESAMGRAMRLARERSERR